MRLTVRPQVCVSVPFDIFPACFEAWENSDWFVHAFVCLSGCMTVCFLFFSFFFVCPFDTLPASLEVSENLGLPVHAFVCMSVLTTAHLTPLLILVGNQEIWFVSPSIWLCVCPFGTFPAFSETSESLGLSIDPLSRPSDSVRISGHHQFALFTLLFTRGSVLCLFVVLFQCKMYTCVFLSLPFCLSTPPSIF